tara:strand:+ start:417 stop:1349 length:933 start_codon:yes stop_codon:yes gene_type:complete
MIRDLKKCNICESDDFTILHYYEKHYYDSKKFIKHSWDGDLDLDLSIVKCKKCELVFQNPCINEKALKFFYPEEIIPEKINLNKELNNHKFNYLLNEIIFKIYSKNGKNISVLDVGARYGILSTLLNKNGFNAFSLEYNKKCVKTAISSGVKKIDTGTIENISLLAQKYLINNFNIVVLNDVIEHLINPKKDLLIISKFQSSGDRIIITTPNFDSLGYKIFKKYWYYIHGQHTFYFTTKTIALMAKKINYELEFTHSISFYKNLKIIFSNFLKFITHIFELNFLDFKNKKWFARNRPYLYDTITLVLKKK